MLLLYTCPGGTGGPRPVHEQCRLLSSMGPGGGLGLGTVLAQAEPYLLTSAEGLCFPGGPFHSKSKRAVAGAGASVLPQLELAPLPPPDPQEGWLCHPAPAALALLWLPL